MANLRLPFARFPCMQPFLVSSLNTNIIRSCASSLSAQQSEYDKSFNLIFTCFCCLHSLHFLLSGWGVEPGVGGQVLLHLLCSSSSCLLSIL